MRNRTILIPVLGLIITAFVMICLHLSKTRDNNTISLNGQYSYPKNNNFTKDTVISNLSVPSKKADTVQKLNAAKLLLQESAKKCLLKGIVIIKNTSIPVPNVLIRCAESKYSINDLEDKKSPTKYNDNVHVNITDEKGNFAFSLLPGSYTVSAMYSEHAIEESVVKTSISPEKGNYVQLELSPYGKIEGIVVSEDDLTPISNASIWLHNIFSGYGVYSGNIDTTTDDKGKFCIDFVKPLNENEAYRGEIMYLLHVIPMEFYPYEDVVAVYPGETTFLEIKLKKIPPPMLIKGHVKDSIGNPIQGISIGYRLAEPNENELLKHKKLAKRYNNDAAIRNEMFFQGYSTLFKSETDVLGAYEEEIGISNYNKLFIFIQPQKGYAMFEEEISQISGKTCELNVVLQEGIHVYGYVLDSAGNPLENVSISADLSEDIDLSLGFLGTYKDNWWTAKTDIKGYFDITGLTPEIRYDINISADDYKSINIKNAVAASQTLNVYLEEELPDNEDE